MKAIKFVCSLALLGSTMVAAESPDLFEWISDPEALAALGFDPEGPAIQRLIIEPDLRPMEARLAERAQIENSVTGGIPGVASSVSVQATDFQLLGDEAAYTTQGNFNFSCLTGTPTNLWADAALPLPNGYPLQFFDVWTYDESETGSVTAELYRACQPIFSAAAPVVTLLASISSSGSSGNQFSFVGIPGSIRAESAACTYWVRAKFSSCDPGIDLKIHKARVVWGM